MQQPEVKRDSSRDRESGGGEWRVKWEMEEVKGEMEGGEGGEWRVKGEMEG